jgi:UDPglucose--hexose-1-phosphate uridylyltransferase
VVVHGPRHVRSLGDLDDRLIRSVAGVWQARAQRARGEGFRYVQAIVNEGRAAGSSLPHSHSQLVWLPGAPPAVRRERVAPGCPLCELLERELADGRRLVADDGQVVVLARAAGRAPYELLIAPRACEPDAYAGPRLARALVAAAGAIRRLHRIEGRAPLNLWLHTAEQDEAGRHWHLELLPRLTVLAGLELGAELYLNPLPPEEAARALREA